MSNWDRFLETFFKPDMLAKYWPDILKGMVVTLEIAVAVVITGLSLLPGWLPADRPAPR